MANPFNKLRLKSAAPNSTYFNLSCNHLSTCNFSQLRPTYYREMYLGDKFSVKMNLTAFTAPMVVPPMGVCHLKSRAFFVPYRLVWKYFNEFYNKKKVNIANVLYTPECPYISSDDLIDVFINFSSSSGGRDTITLLTPTEGESPQQSCDVNVQRTDDTDTFNNCYNFTPFGRQVYAIFRSLGYAWNWDMTHIQRFSALPILCFLRSYLDYYIPASFIQQSVINGFLHECYTLSDEGQVDVTVLLDCLTHVILSYPDNYFTSAWVTPNAPYGNTTTSQNVNNRYDGSIYSGNEIAADSYQSVVNVHAGIDIAQSGLNILRAFDSWFKRNNFAGAARVSDALLAKFGIRPADSRLDRTEFLGYDDTIIKWQMITNTSSSDGAELGAFGAKGYAEGSGAEFNYEAKEIGLFMVLSSLQPDVIYYHGADKMTMQTEALEFYQPEFEKTSMQPVKVSEIYSDATFSQLQPSAVRGAQGLSRHGLEPNRVYGYVPAYANFKVPKDFITGDFLVPRLASELSSWHFGREFNFDYGNSAGHSEPYNQFMMSPLNVRFMAAVNSQFNRIFNVTDDSADHFIMVYSFKVDAYRPMLSISDSLQIDGFGEQVEVQPDGTHLD